MTGSSGLIGSAVARSLDAAGHVVVRLVRRPPASPDEVRWDPRTGLCDDSRLEGLDGVIHLAGENIAGRRWTEAHKAEIRRSRVEGTRMLCGALARLDRRPAVLLSASAVGIYGDRGGARLREDSEPGMGFLASVCRDWEQATAPAAEAGIRVVLARFGMVLSPSGGALRRMLTPFRLGIGGRVGSGAQFVSWIAIEDVAGAVRHALQSDRLAGPVNFVAPEPVTNAEFTRVLARVLRRPALLPLPALAARLALGEMADELLLGGQRALPARLAATGYAFAHPGLEEALRHLLLRQA